VMDALLALTHLCAHSTLSSVTSVLLFARCACPGPCSNVAVDNMVHL